MCAMRARLVLVGKSQLYESLQTFVKIIYSSSDELRIDFENKKKNIYESITHVETNK